MAELHPMPSRTALPNVSPISIIPFQRNYRGIMVALLGLILALALIAPELSLRAGGLRDTSIAGTYTVNGTNFDGSKYSGTLTVTADGDVYKFDWGTSSGVAVTLNNTVAAAYGDKTCGVALYQLSDDASLNGKWADNGTNKVGTEKDTQTATNDTSADYKIDGTGPDGTAYQGKLHFGQNSKVLDVEWNVGKSLKGIGILDNKMIGVAYGGNNCGIALYQIKDDGTLDGKWSVMGKATVNMEVAKPNGGKSGGGLFGPGSGSNSGSSGGSGDASGTSTGGSGGSGGSSNTGSNATAQALTIGNEAVVTKEGDQVYVMKSPTLGAQRLTLLLAGDPLLITGGPITGSGLTWWQVKLVDGRSGYVVEGYNGVTWITPSTEDRKVNPNNPESNLFMGARCTIGENATQIVVIRDQPSQGGTALKRIQNRDQYVVVMGGPVIAEQRRWWYVRLGADTGNDAADARFGWVAEDSQAYLEPITSPSYAHTVIGGYLAVGRNVRATSSGTDMRIRKEPDVTSSAYTTFGQDVDATIVGGPIDAQGFTWWEIRLGDGTTGWVAVGPGWMEVYNN